MRYECLVPQGLSKCACCPSFEFFATLIGEMCMSLQFQFERFFHIFKILFVDLSMRFAYLCVLPFFSV